MTDESAKVNAPAWTVWIDPVSKLGALFLFIIYALGYLITSIHLASMGMNLGNPLKPRIAAAGVLFSFLFGLPVWVLSETLKRTDPVPSELACQKWFAALYKMMRFFHVSFFLSVPLLVIFKFTGKETGWRGPAIFVLIAVETAFIVTARSSLSFRNFLVRHPYWFRGTYPLFLVMR